MPAPSLRPPVRGSRMPTDAGNARNSAGPFTGIRVLDLSSYVAGPYACSLLADLGAEVIKIEPHGGDTLRYYPSTLTGNSARPGRTAQPGVVADVPDAAERAARALETESRAFLGTNRSKRGIVLDLKREAGREVFMRLVQTADVLVHNFRPSVPSRLGIDYAQLKAGNPRLIYCALAGYGETGPVRDKAGYDQVLQCFTGIATFQGAAGGKPEIVLGSVVDFYAASLLAYGVSAALFHRERTGEGQYVGLSLLGAALAMQSGRFVWARDEDAGAGRDLRSGGITGIHPTSEGDIYVSANTAHFWRSLCALTGLSGLADDPRYDTVRKRAKCADERRVGKECRSRWSPY